MIGAFYGFGKDHFAATEDIWEGTFGIIASLIISIMGAALLRVSKLQDKWRVKLAQALEAKEATSTGSATTRFKRWAEKYAMFMLPFITVLREGLEAVVFIGGVSLGLPATSFPLAVICGLAAGGLVGYLIYRFVFLTVRTKRRLLTDAVVATKHPSKSSLSSRHVFSTLLRRDYSQRPYGIFKTMPGIKSLVAMPRKSVRGLEGTD